MKNKIGYLISIPILLGAVFIWHLFGGRIGGIPFVFFILVVFQILVFCIGFFAQKFNGKDTISQATKVLSEPEFQNDQDLKDDPKLSDYHNSQDSSSKQQSVNNKYPVSNKLMLYFIYKNCIIFIVIFLGYLFVLNGRYSQMVGNLYFDKWNKEIIEFPIPKDDIAEIEESEKTDDIADLYKALTNSNYTEKELGGSLTSFRKFMSNRENRKKMYDWIVSNDDFDLPAYDSFEEILSNAYDN